ncbi:MAG TPA: PBSX family phage terminase large subunit [Stackebrandtia sp.]|jgi:PBSX family phage terminase large subunit|uniref:PBSX family phage terminase large subunit n=1 Tax=Stackebrandtia sp. TaxID=2023065 RepID=UPI002D56CBDF|nr:PBSX family phage terminase large subunit [Stackebrandtia sp.]HZE37764.1 PBSX family phage terminase large subunit [Stackebrandtia sp.]
MQVAPLQGKALAAVGLCTARLNIFEGAVRSGKTIASLLAWLKFVREAPEGPLLMVGKTERTLKRNILDPLIEMLGNRRCKLIGGAGELWLLGRLVYIAGANDERSQEKIRGLTLVGAYVDEASILPESFWAMLKTRLSVEGARLICTTNPDGPNHWLKRDHLNRATVHLTREGEIQRFQSEDLLDLHRFSFQLDDNPSLPRSYIEETKKEHVGLWYRRLVLGDWCLAEGAVYEMFDPDRHVVDELPPIQQWIACGVDYGTVNPFAALMFGAGVDGNLYVGHEWWWDSKRQHKQLTDVEYSAKLRAWMDTDLGGIRPQHVIVDPSAASFNTQLWQDKLSPVLGDNAVLDGIRTVSSLFARDRLYVHRSCRNLLNELPGYSWDDDKAAKGEDAPIKVDDHAVDALRYAIHTTESKWRPHLREAA